MKGLTCSREESGTRCWRPVPKCDEEAAARRRRQQQGDDLERRAAAEMRSRWASCRQRDTSVDHRSHQDGQDDVAQDKWRVVVGSWWVSSNSQTRAPPSGGTQGPRDPCLLGSAGVTGEVSRITNSIQFLDTSSVRIGLKFVLLDLGSHFSENLLFFVFQGRILLLSFCMSRLGFPFGHELVSFSGLRAHVCAKKD